MSDGLGTDAIHFFDDLDQNNNRQWWKANANRYATAVCEPFLELIESIDPDLDWRTYRPHRDTRFARDKTPYKNFIGAATQLPTGNGYFVRIDRHGLLVASGYPMMAKDQLARFRAALDDTEAGNRFVAAVDQSTNRDGITITEGRYPPLATAPRGYPRNHPRIRWLRTKGVEIPQRIVVPNWLSHPDAGTRILDLLQEGRSVTDWLDRHVGPSELTPEEIWGR